MIQPCQSHQSLSYKELLVAYHNVQQEALRQGVQILAELMELAGVVVVER